MEDLPRGWTEAAIGDVVELQLGKMLDKARNIRGRSYPYLRNINVRWFSFDISDLLEMRFEDNEAEKFAIADGDILVCEGGEPGRAAVWRGGRTHLKYQKALHRVRPCAAVLPDWIALFLRHAADDGSLEGYFTGTTIKHLPAQALAAVKLPLPPLAEQRRIVARIEALFARTCRARAELGRTQALAAHLLERSRVSIFSNVTSSGEIGGQEFADLQPYTPPARFEGLPDLPPRWRWVQMDAVAQVTGGLTKNKNRNSLAIRMPYLRVANVYADELRLEEIATIGATNAERERVSLRAGDLLVVEGNGSLDQIGRVAVWDGGVEGCGHQNHLIRVRPLGGVPSRWLLHWLMSPYGRAVLEAAASSSSGLHTLSLSKIASLPVPLPSSCGEAEAVVEAGDAALARGRRAEAEATRALALLDRLDAAILARAFRGELVPQDPADEPARLPHSLAAIARPRRRAAPPV